MKTSEYLLSTMMEELAEVQQELSKCLRFTPDHRPGQDGPSNFDRANNEWNDVLALIMLLEKEGLVFRIDPSLISAKIKRLERIMEVSRRLGALNG